VVRHIYETHGEDTEILFGPDMWLGAFVEKELGRRMHVWDGECHVHAGIRPGDIEATRAAHPGADFLIHPECGCRPRVIDSSHGGNVSGGAGRRGCAHLDWRHAALCRGAERSGDTPREVVGATEVGRLHPLRMAAPDVDFIPDNPEASCVYMKMITLPKLRDALRDMKFEVRVPEDVAARAKVPIDRMVAIG
jgi:quinolinate synthase